MNNEKSSHPSKTGSPGKADFDLHVLLIMKLDGKKKPDAMVTAYSEGLAGLNRRLSIATP